MEIILKEEVYLTVGYCIEVWKTLGYGFSEVVYKDAIIEATAPQALNYLRASGFKIGLIINFGKTKLDFKRLIL